MQCRKNYDEKRYTYSRKKGVDWFYAAWIINISYFGDKIIYYKSMIKDKVMRRRADYGNSNHQIHHMWARIICAVIQINKMWFPFPNQYNLERTWTQINPPFIFYNHQESPLLNSILSCRVHQNRIMDEKILRCTVWAIH